MKGWIIKNGFLDTPKMLEPIQQLMDSAQRKREQLIVKDNSELLPILSGKGIELNERLPDYVIFWDKDIRLAKSLELMGIRLFNSSKAIEICDDKSLMYQTLAKHGFEIPLTVVSPKTYDGFGYSEQFIKRILSKFPFPFIAKDCFGSFGEQVHLIERKEDLEEVLKSSRPMVFQEFIETSKGRDVRIQVVGGKAVAAMYRESSGDFRANASLGAKIRSYSPSAEEAELAVNVAEKLGLDFAGVDLLFGKNGPVVCEVNSNAHMKNLMDCTGVNAADAIIEHIRGTL